MDSPREERRPLHFYGLAVGVLAFVTAAGLMIAGRRAFFNWVLLVGTFCNLMIYRALFKNRSRAG